VPKIEDHQVKKLTTPFILSFLAAAACGPTVSNTDKPASAYIAGAPEVSGDFGVRLADSAPASGGSPVSGISCKNKFWEPEPTSDVAVSVLRREASASGYNAVYVQSVGPAANALALNCWAAIEAKGIAFND
jgi:hypothetical protein